MFVKTHPSAFFLVGGFIFDNFTLRRSDRLAENLVLLFYVLVSGLCILAINYFKVKYPEGDNAEDPLWVNRTKFGLLAFTQFSFGNLFSAFLIFYSRSSSLEASAPFLLLLVGLMIANELLKERYQKLAFQVGVWFFTVFSFLIFFLPVVLKSLNVWLFLLSGLLSLVFVGLLVRGLMLIIKQQVIQSKQAIFAVVGSIYLAINFLYFTNLIPPIPLAMKDSGVYHSIVPSGGAYNVLAEEKSLFDRFKLRDTFHVVAGQPLYLYSAIFAPSNLDTNIVHDWQRYDSNNYKWVSSSRIVIPITGGREDGYRLYTYKALQTGLWRVDIKTSRGQIIGRVKFNVEQVIHAPALYPKQL